MPANKLPLVCIAAMVNDAEVEKAQSAEHTPDLRGRSLFHCSGCTVSAIPGIWDDSALIWTLTKVTTRFTLPFVQETRDE